MHRQSRLLLLRLVLPFLITTLSLFVACGGATDDTTIASGDAAAKTPTALPHATPTPTTSPSPVADDTQPVLRIDLTGGFAPASALTGDLPQLVVYPDGLVLTPGSVPLIFPPPALPNVQQARISPDGVDEVVRRAEAAGLLDGDQQYGIVMVADAQTTIFTVHINGETDETSVYGLGFTNLSPDATEEERLARERLLTFHDEMLRLLEWLPADDVLEQPHPYGIERLQIISQPAGPFEAPDPAIQPNEIDWRLTEPLSEFGDPYALQESRCGVVEGDELAILLQAFGDATAFTRWQSAGEKYVLYPHPLLPGETGCDGHGSEQAAEASPTPQPDIACSVSALREYIDPLDEGNKADLVLIVTTAEVLPPQWDTPNAVPPDDPCLGHTPGTIVTPVVLKVDDAPVNHADVELEAMLAVTSYGGTVENVTFHTGETWTLGERAVVSLESVEVPGQPRWHVRTKLPISPDGLVNVTGNPEPVEHFIDRLLAAADSP